MSVKNKGKGELSKKFVEKAERDDLIYTDDGDVIELTGDPGFDSDARFIASSANPKHNL